VEVARALSADAITLTLPHAKPYHGVARLVVGGLAARLALSYENLEDLQLALESVLERDGYVRGDRVTVRLLVGEESVVLEVGPLDPVELRADLDRADGDPITLARLLATLVDEVSLEESGGDCRLRLEKRASFARPEPRGIA
jgi:hypothetical protein